MTILLIVAVIGIALLVSRRKPSPIVKEKTIEEAMDEVVKKPLLLPLKPIEDGYVLRPQPVWPVLGGTPASAGYAWNEELNGWIRPWEGESSLIPRGTNPSWDKLIPELGNAKEGFVDEVRHLIDSNAIPPPPIHDPFAPVAQVYPPLEPYWDGTKWVMRSRRTPRLLSPQPSAPFQVMDF